MNIPHWAQVIVALSIIVSPIFIGFMARRDRERVYQDIAERLIRNS